MVRFGHKVLETLIRVLENRAGRVCKSGRLAWLRPCELLGNAGLDVSRKDLLNVSCSKMRQLTNTALRERLPDWGVLMLESHHSPEFTMDWRTHPFLKIVFVLSGDGKFHFQDDSLTFCAGDVVIVPPGARNRIEDAHGSASSLYVCCVATSLMKFDGALVDRFAIRRFHNEPHFANRAAAMMRRMVHAQDRGGVDQPIALVSDALRLLELILKQASRPSEPARSKTPSPDRELVVRYIKSLPSEFFEATTIDAAAASLQMPRRTFTKLFAEEAGETWLQCIRRLAIEHATTRLKESQLPITSIAFECGFNDLSTFYRQFKTQVGMPPSEYRANH